MPVSDFKFVSPGVFINEIDNSFLPREADAIGPVVIGRATRGLAMQPIKVDSYSQFVEMFGDTVPGNGGGDIYRDGNFQSPMYGTYAAKAFLRSNVAPLTYVRLLGQQTSVGSAAAGDAASGWRTVTNAGTATNPARGTTAGGAYGLFLAKSSSNGIITAAAAGTGASQLAAIIYVGSGSVKLSGSLAGHATTAFGAGDQVKGSSCLVESDTSGRFKIIVDGAINGEKSFIIGMDEDSDEYYIRKVLSTNPQLTSLQGAFYPSASAQDYWLGETFEQEMRDAALTSGNLVGFIAAIATGSAAATGPHNMKSTPSQEAIAGWFIGQDIGSAADFNPYNAKKLFRFIGRGHGSWLHKNAKVSIANIKQTNTTTNEYGSFSVIVRKITDTDSAVEVLERFDNCNLDPSSPNYVAKLIGDKYQEWDTTKKELKEYGDYDNNSKYIRIDMNADVEAGATDPVLLPFGYYGPPKFKDVIITEVVGPRKFEHVVTASYLRLGTGSLLPGTGSAMTTAFGAVGSTLMISSSYGVDLTCSVSFPSARLRNKATDNVMSDQTKAYFGIDTTRQTTATSPQAGIFDTHRLLYGGLGNTNNVPSDPTATSIVGVEGYSYIFTMDNLTTTSSVYTYLSGARTANESVSAVSGYTALLDADINKFTAPFWGGFDGFDIIKPDPLYNGGMSSTSTEDDSYAYHTYTRAIQTVSDPEYINMNLLSIPGLTNTALTSLMVEKCAERADALALIDLPDVYRPSHEQYYADKTSRIGTTPIAAANALKLRRVDSSYGATFYPWVKTVDAKTSQLVWIPPTVAMMGVLASSERASEIWFAPAGFNRGGLTDGAAGIPITQVSERLSSKDRDTLYEARINPIASFPSEGIVVFGQKTLQERPSALDRINVRRLVIFLKKQISILSTQVLFEQNVEATWNNFRALIRPLLAGVQTRLGITDYKLILDSSTTTPDLIDQNILYAKIMVKPARAIEYIAIDFVIASSGASFDD